MRLTPLFFALLFVCISLTGGAPREPPLDPYYATEDSWADVDERFLEGLRFHENTFFELTNSSSEALAARSRAKYARPTVAEFIGVISAYFKRGADRRTFLEDMYDMAYLQLLELQYFDRLIAWVQLPSYLHMAREDQLRATSKFERWRLERRFQTALKRDLGFLNLGDVGELERFLQIKWVNEYVATVLAPGSADHENLMYCAQLLRERLADTLSEGSIQERTAELVERYARGKLRLEYAYGRRLWGKVGTNGTLTAMVAQRVEPILRNTRDLLLSITVSATSPPLPSAPVAQSFAARALATEQDVLGLLTRTKFQAEGDFDLARIASGIASALQVHMDVHVSRIQLYLERIIDLRPLLVEEKDREERLSWSSDRTSSPVAVFSSSIQVSDLDLLVWLDSADFHRGGQAHLWLEFGYTAAQVDMISQKTAVSLNRAITANIRNSTSAEKWLGGRNDDSAIDQFEFWRWTWVRPDAQDLMVNGSSSMYNQLPAGNLAFGAIVAALGTLIMTIINIVKLLVTQPWTRHTLEASEEESVYEAREWRIVWFRALPYDVFVTYGQLLLTTWFILSLSLAYVHPVALILYVVSFWFLVGVIVDVYCGKLVLYAVSLFFYGRLSQCLKEPLPPGAIGEKNGMLLLNPLRPASDEQLRAVIRKNVDMLAGTSGTKHVVSVIILQTVGNSLKTFRRYEKILREEIYNNDDVPIDVKDRCFVFQMGGIAKPHNIYKVMRFLHQQDEELDPVTTDFIFGIKTSEPLLSGLLVDKLLRVGGDIKYKGKDGCGADAGILTTVTGLELLRELRNFGKPQLPNMLVLDSDNSVDPVLILQMAGAMNDDYMVWQPAINFYNARQSLFAYMKGYSNEHLGAMSNIGTSLVLGGVRSFGKYFARTSMFYHEEVARRAIRKQGSHFSGWWSLTRLLALALTFLLALIPVLAWWIPVVACIASAIAVASLAFVSWRNRYGPLLARPMSNRYQEMFPLSRNFIQSEDARHGGPFGRAVFVSQGVIHESTPPSFLDEMDRENSKWMPTFDARDYVLLHSPVLWICAHPVITSVIFASATLLFLLGIILSSVYFVDAGLLIVLGAGFIASGAVLLTASAFWKSTTGEGYRLLGETKFPDMPLRGEYSEGLVARGLFSEVVWGLQVFVALLGLLVPGVLELAYPGLGEVLLLLVVGLIVQVKFSASLCTRLHHLVYPVWHGVWSEAGGESGTKTYRMARVPRLYALMELLVLWPLYDIPLGLFEFSASTAIFLIKLLHKPAQVLYALIGVVLELRGLLRQVPVSGTWPSFEESTSTVPFSRYVYEFHIVMALGVGLTLLTFGAPKEALYNGPFAPLFEPVSIVIMAVVAAFFLGLVPLAFSLYQLWIQRKERYTFARIRFLLSVVGSLIATAGLLAVGFLVSEWQGMVPGVFLIRAFPILLSSFVFGPGVAYACGIILCQPDENNPIYMVGRWRWTAPIVVLSCGYAFGALAIFFSVPFPYLRGSVQNLATFVPTGDGVATVVVPFQISYHNLMQVPWYFVLPFSIVVYCSLFFGAACNVLAIVSIVWEGIQAVRKAVRSLTLEEEGEGDKLSTAARAEEDSRLVQIEEYRSKTRIILPEAGMRRSVADMWFSGMQMPSLVAVDNGRRPYLPLLFDQKRLETLSPTSADMLIDSQLLDMPMSQKRKLSAIAELLAREQRAVRDQAALSRADSVDRVIVQLPEGESSSSELAVEGDGDGHPVTLLDLMDEESSSAEGNRLSQLVIEVSSSDSEDESSLDIAAATMVPQHLMRKLSMPVSAMDPAIVTGRRRSAPAQVLEKVVGARIPLRKRSLVLELPISAIKIRKDEVIDPSPATIEEVFSDGRDRKYSVDVVPPYVPRLGTRDPVAPYVQYRRQSVISSPRDASAESAREGRRRSSIFMSPRKRSALAARGATPRRNQQSDSESVEMTPMPVVDGSQSPGMDVTSISGKGKEEMSE